MSEDKLIWKWRWWYLHGKTDFVSRAHDGVQEQKPFAREYRMEVWQRWLGPRESRNPSPLRSFRFAWIGNNPIPETNICP